MVRVCPNNSFDFSWACDSTYQQADHCELDEGDFGAGQVLKVFAQPSAASEPAESPLNDPAFRQNLEALCRVAALDDLKRRPGGPVDGGGGPGALIAAVGYDGIQKRELSLHLFQHRDAAIPVLNIGRRDIETDHQTKRIDRRMTLDAFDFFACIIANGINFRPPFSAAFTLWASMIAQVGLASRPACARAST
jgi:hypothetical protein